VLAVRAIFLGHYIELDRILGEVTLTKVLYPASRNEPEIQASWYTPYMYKPGSFRRNLELTLIVWAWRWFQMKKDFELQSDCLSLKMISNEKRFWTTKLQISMIYNLWYKVYLHIYIYIYRVILKCTQVHSVYQMHRPCGCNFAAEPIATWQQLQLDANQLQLDGPIATQREPIATRREPIATKPSWAATRREPIATKRLTDCNCDTILIATWRN
jgi:hypothetical protein